MPIIGQLDHEEQQGGAAGSFGYSAASIPHLEEKGATEYTLAQINVDVSGSVDPFKGDIEAAIEAAVEALKKSPRNANILVRVSTFASQVHEMHGFRLLADIDASEYRGSLTTGGLTALYKSDIDGTWAVADYAEKLAEKYFLTNGITVTITDGGDNMGGQFHVSQTDVMGARVDATRGEKLESLLSVLIGVNVEDDTLRGILEEYQREGGFDQYTELGDASPATLARIGVGISRNVSSQSSSLGSGEPSKPIAF